MTAVAGAAETIHPFKVRVACAATVFIASLVLYAFTLAPTVTFVDSGELIVAARSLGVAHPPGFPLYVLLAHLATLVPIGNVAVRVNCASALFAALASSVITLVLIEAMINARLPALANHPRKKSERGKKGRRSEASGTQRPNESGVLSALVLVVSCLTSGLLLAFSRTLWGYATIAEVYTLNTLLILVVFLLMFRWRREIIERRAQKHDPDGPARVSLGDRPLYAAAFVFGLALGVHHVTVGLMLPALAALVITIEGIWFFRTKRLLFAALFAFAGVFLVYAYLPVAASRSPIMNWGDPRTLERLWWHVTGRQYQVFLSFSLNTMASQFSEFMKLAAREFGPWWIPAGPLLVIAGLVSLFRRDKAMFWFLSLVIAADLVYCLGYEIAEDKDAYYLPVFIAMAIAAGFGAQWFIYKVTSMRPASRTAGYVAIAAVLLVPIGALASNLSYDNRSRYFVAQDYVDNILSTVEPGGMLLTRDWQVYSPMLYFREVEHRREDTVVIDVNQLRRSWYFDYLGRAFPATLEQARDKVDAFLEDLRQWERDPKLYDRDLTLNQRINSRFYEMILAFVTNHVRGAPVYVTLDIAANREGPDSELTKGLVGSYQLIPQGLVFQVTPNRGFLQPADPPLLTRGLIDGTIQFEDVDVVKVKVLPVYVTMLYNRGRYLAANGRHEQAIESFKQALALQPSFSVAQQAINESLSAIRKGIPNSRQ
jgi:tetratricopeptide (TPR) repeat protein